MLSAITLTDAVHTEYSALSSGSNRAVIYKMDTSGKTKMEIDLDKVLVKSDSTFENISEALPSDECRFIYFNLDYMEGLGHRTKTFFVLWAPCDANGKNKMIYASCTVPLKAKLGGSRSLSIHAEDATAFDFNDLVARCRSLFH